MKLAMLGLGAMGARMARRAVDGGVQVITWNRSARHVPGATAARSPREAAAAADVVVSMVTDVEASRAVWLGPDGARSGLREGALAVEASTVTPAWSVELARAVEAGGARYLEAPVVGTRPHAEQGLLTVLAGGAQADVAAAEPVLTTWGKVVHAGPVGAAMPLKLAINTLFAAQVGLLAEALALLTGAGIDDERALTLLEGTPVFPPVLQGIAKLLRAGTDEPMFPVALVAKDVGYAAAQGPLPLFEAVHARYEAACEAGLGDRNIHAITRLYR